MMDKQLLLKILGKKDFTDLEDEIFNLRNLTGDLREKIVLNLDIEEDFINDVKSALNKIYLVVNRINTTLENSNTIPGYTNSKKYLKRFVNSLCVNIKNLLTVIDPPYIERVSYYNNIIIDLILSY